MITQTNLLQQGFGKIAVGMALSILPVIFSAQSSLAIPLEPIFDLLGRNALSDMFGSGFNTQALPANQQFTTNTTEVAGSPDTYPAIQPSPTPTYSPSTYPADNSQPVYPNYPSPTYQQPTYPSYPPPTYQQPSYPNYPSPNYQQPTYPSYPPPTYQQPAYPSYPSPNYQQPSYPNYPSPNYQQPSYPNYPSPNYQQPSYPNYLPQTYQQPSYYQQPPYQQQPPMNSYSQPLIYNPVFMMPQAPPTVNNFNNH